MTRYVIQEKATLHYLSPANRWVPFADRARTFPSMTSALLAAYHEVDLPPETWTIVAVERPGEETAA